MIHQKALYLCSTPKGQNEDLLLFIVPKVHQVATLNRCHRDAGHQGSDHTAVPIAENILVARNDQSDVAINQDLVHTAYNMRAACPRPLYTLSWPLPPWISLHVDFTSIETTLEQNKSPRVTNILVFQDHFTKHVLAYVTPNQAAKTIAKFLYQGYISIFGAPARLLSDKEY